MQALTYGTVFETITKRTFENWEILLPPLPEQRVIAYILGTLDDKIELNLRMNQTLEEIARAIFQDWFVDFGPVRAKLEGREPYLPPELWDLFPERLVDSELGEIPEGWKVGALDDAIDILSGGTPQDIGVGILGWRHSLVHRKGRSIFKRHLCFDYRKVDNPSGS